MDHNQQAAWSWIECEIKAVLQEGVRFHSVGFPSPTALSVSVLPPVSNFQTKEQVAVSPHCLTPAGTQPHGVQWYRKNLMPYLNPYRYSPNFLCCFARNPHFAAEIFFFLSWLLAKIQILCHVVVKLHLQLFHFPSDNIPFPSGQTCILLRRPTYFLLVRMPLRRLVGFMKLIHKIQSLLFPPFLPDSSTHLLVHPHFATGFLLLGCVLAHNPYTTH